MRREEVSVVVERDFRHPAEGCIATGAAELPAPALVPQFVVLG